MRYVCLVYGDGTAIEALPEDEKRKLDRDSIAYDKVLEQVGHLIAADALESVSRATCLRTRGGKVVSIDGPFAESKEQLLGFLLIEAKDREEAIALASKVPMVGYGTIEVRATHDIEVD